MKERVCVYPKDVQIITGKSERWGREVINRIRKQYNKEKHQLVTVDELSQYLGIDISTIKQMIY